MYVSWAAVAAFALIGLPALLATTGFAGLVKFWLMPWLGEFDVPVFQSLVLSCASSMQLWVFTWCNMNRLCCNACVMFLTSCERDCV